MKCSFVASLRSLLEGEILFPSLKGLYVNGNVFKATRTNVHPLLTQAEDSTQKEHLIDPTKSSFQNIAKFYTATGK